ncbi:MAG: hypothetical protein ACJAUS_001548 [Qipengyuania sp.]|jgi:hypothetical protein
MLAIPLRLGLGGVGVSDIKAPYGGKSLPIGKPARCFDGKKGRFVAG